jgi:hypothetical protein
VRILELSVALSSRLKNVHSAQNKHVGQAVLSGAVTACALSIGHYWLLLENVSVFWVLLRVLACGGVGVLAWVGWTGQLKSVRRKSVEVRERLSDS